MTSAAVETFELRKDYGRVQALRGVSLSVARGEIFALLGENGAGKTTWISILCGLARATGGRAEILGCDLARDPVRARREIGLVPQDANVDPYFTPRQVLGYQLGYYDRPHDGKRVDEMLDVFALREVADVAARELSGGMKRRVLVAKALVHRPQVVFLDEPTAGVDVPLRRELWAYVRALRDTGTTFILTTHYLEEAEALADRIALLERGLVRAVDTPRALIATAAKKTIRVTLREPIALPEPLAALGATIDGRVITCPVAAHAGEAGASDQLAALLAAIATLPIADLAVDEPSLEHVVLQLAERAR